jgi:hypothetical protein
VGHGEDFAVLIDRERCAVSPTPALDDPLASRLTDTSTQNFIVKTSANGSGECIGVSCWAGQHRVTVPSGDLGQCATSRRDEAYTRRHCFDRREAESFVETWHHGQLALGIQLDDALVGDARDERNAVEETE